MPVRRRSLAAALLLALFGALAIAPSPASAAPKRTKVALLPIDSRDGVSPILAEVVTEALAAELTSRPELTVITPKDVEAALGFERQKAKLNATVAEQTGGEVCTENSCLQEIGGALGVDLTVSGTISRLGSSWILTVQAFDPRKAEVVRRKLTRVSSDQQDALLDVVPGVADELFPRADGTVRQTASSASAPPQQPSTPAAQPQPQPFSVAAQQQVLAAVGSEAAPGSVRTLSFRLDDGGERIRIKLTSGDDSKSCPSEVTTQAPCSVDFTSGRTRVSISGELSLERDVNLPHYVREITVVNKRAEGRSTLLKSVLIGGGGALLLGYSLYSGCEVSGTESKACQAGIGLGGGGAVAGLIGAIIGLVQLGSDPELVVAGSNVPLAERPKRSFGKELLSRASFGASSNGLLVGTAASF